MSGTNTICIISKIFHIPQIFFRGYIIQVAHVQRCDRLVFRYLQFWHFTSSVHHFLSNRIINTIIPNIYNITKKSVYKFLVNNLVSYKCNQNENMQSNTIYFTLE